MQMKKIVCAVIMGLSLHSGMANAAGIPVIDAANLANTAQNLVQWSKQLVEMKNHLDQLKATYDSLNGLRGVGGLLNNELLVQYLPKDYQSSLDALLDGTGGDFAGISGTLNNIVTANQKYTCAALNDTPTLISQCEAQWTKLALDKNIGEMGYKQAAKNIENLQVFINGITTSTDPKSIQDLQARIAVEQVRMQNEQVKLETIKMMAEASRKLESQKISDSLKAGMRLSSDESGVSF